MALIYVANAIYPNNNLGISIPLEISKFLGISIPLVALEIPNTATAPKPYDSSDHGNRTALVRCGSHASMTFCRTALEIGAQNRVQKPPQILYAKGPARKCGCDQRRALQRELQKKRESPANGVVESAGPP